MLVKDCKTCFLRKSKTHPPYETYCGHPDGSQDVKDDLHELCPLKEGALMVQLDEGEAGNLKKASRAFIEAIKGSSLKVEVKFRNSYEVFIGPKIESLD